MNIKSKAYKKGFNDGYLRGIETTNPNWNSKTYWEYRDGYSKGVQAHCDEYDRDHPEVVKLYESWGLKV